MITDATDVPPNSIDLVYSSKVLEDIENNIEALGKLYASLKPGRRSKFWVPAFECLWSVIGRSTAAAIPVGRSRSRSGRRGFKSRNVSIKTRWDFYLLACSKESVIVREIKPYAAHVGQIRVSSFPAIRCFLFQAIRKECSDLRSQASSRERVQDSLSTSWNIELCGGARSFRIRFYARSCGQCSTIEPRHAGRDIFVGLRIRATSRVRRRRKHPNRAASSPKP